ncbi:MAG: GTP cyclohydrolase II [Candidatus ainarchaeum sp.]|nr:GTP cyclohydrolase II [Candidatus ainarchaeum sp.]
MNIPKAVLPTSFGQFTIYSFSDDLIALVKGDIFNTENILVRVHSECLTSEIFQSLRCDCKKQLDKSLELISKEGGLLIYLRNQEGRGIGLNNKIKAYELQDGGLDTVDANHQLGFASDLRSYKEVKKILDFFNIKKIRLLTNNPDKMDQLSTNGVIITERIPLIIPPSEHSKNYLTTKKDKLGHWL